MLKVSIRCTGYGNTHDETVELSLEDIENLAISKLQESDASPRMMALDTEVCFKP